MGWSRTGISTTALVNWLCMGVSAFIWGALSDRFGTRAVVLSGGVLLGLGLVTASRAATLGQFQLLFGVLVGAAAGSFFAPLVATTTRWFTKNRSLAVAVVSAGARPGRVGGRPPMLRAGGRSLPLTPPGRPARARPPAGGARRDGRRGAAG